MAAEQLIELIKQHDAIYNTKCNEYRDVKLRKAAWENIAKQRGKSVEECKEDWSKLRSCFTNAMRRRRRKSSHKLAPWRYEELMSFLKPHTEGRYITNDPDSPESDNEECTAFYLDNSLSDNSSPSPPSNISAKRRASFSEENDTVDIPKISNSSQENPTSSQQILQEMDDVDMFFLSMSRITKKLPKLDQIDIKLDLHKAVSEAEIRQVKKSTLGTGRVYYSHKSSAANNSASVDDDDADDDVTESKPIIF